MNNRNKVNSKKGLGFSDGEQVWLGWDPSDLQAGPGRHPTTAVKSKSKSNKIPLIISCWNVRTLLDISNSNRPERRTALVAKELSKLNIDIAALSETRFSEYGHLVERASGYTFFWKGKPEGVKREAGVGFAIKTTLVQKLHDLPHGHSDRIMSCRIPLALFSIYALTLSHTPE